jgi:hypothetical protein
VLTWEKKSWAIAHILLTGGKIPNTMISINEREIIMLSRHASVPPYHPSSRPKSELANARSRQVLRLSGRHIPFFNGTITRNRSTCNTTRQGLVTEYTETISNVYKNSGDDFWEIPYIKHCEVKDFTAKFAVDYLNLGIPANDSELISTEPIPNIDDLELVEALARLYQMKQTSSVRAAEFCLRAEIASRGDRS